jgi:hypothetical protein
MCSTTVSFLKERRLPEAGLVEVKLGFIDEGTNIV